MGLPARRSSWVGSSFSPLCKHLVFMFLQIISKFRNPGNKRSFVQSACSLERGDKAATPPPRPREQPFPRAGISVQPAELRTGGPGAEGDERLSLSVGTPGKTGSGSFGMGAQGSPRALSAAGRGRGLCRSTLQEQGVCSELALRPVRCWRGCNSGCGDTRGAAPIRSVDAGHPRTVLGRVVRGRTASARLRGDRGVDIPRTAPGPPAGASPS